MKSNQSDPIWSFGYSAWTDLSMGSHVGVPLTGFFPPSPVAQPHLCPSTHNSQPHPQCCSSAPNTNSFIHSLECCDITGETQPELNNKLIETSGFKWTGLNPKSTQDSQLVLSTIWKTWLQQILSSLHL